MIELLHTDCMDYLATLPDKAFELAIVDPPYGIGAENHAGNKDNGWNQWDIKQWDQAIPTKEYFTELFRISRNQIICGGNYFTDYLPSSQCWLVWDKGQRNFSLADAELIWTSFKKSVRVFGYARGRANNENKIHPTQKPVALYKWLLHNYASPGDRILDTHLGSGSSAIAAHQMGFDFVGCELYKDYYDAAVKRYNNAIKQQSLF